MNYRDSQPRTVRLAEYRPPAFLIDSTDLVIELGETETLVSSSLAIRRNPAAPAGQALELHGVDLTILSLAIDGDPLDEDDYLVRGEVLEIRRAVPDSFRFEARVVIRPQANTSLEGLYRSRNLYCTQCEAEGFRKITFYLDRPDVMAVFTTRIVAHRASFPVLLSNGNPVGSGELEDGRHWVEWHDPFPKPSYLFAMVAGDLSCVEDRYTTLAGRHVDLRIYVEAKDLDKCAFAMESLKLAMTWDEQRYGREYDLDIYMIVAVDDFNMGAMENKGLNIFNASAVLARQEITTDATFENIRAIVAHEYFHNWSGNRVTCRDWFQLSLKEGFTVFRDAEFSADHGSPTVKRVQDVNLLRTLQFAEDGGPMAHPVQPASYMEISNFYTLTVYEKGAEVVRMIHTLLGAELFRRGTDLYFDRHDGQAVTIEDFVAAMAEVSGRDFGQFMHWYRQAGTPVVEVEGHYDSARRTYTLEFRQSCPPTPECGDKQPCLIPVRLGLVGREGDLPLHSECAGGETETVLEIGQSRQQVVFRDVAEAPVPSLFRGFSAPVKWRFPYSRDDLMFLMVADSDGFNRWESGNQLALDIMMEAVAARAAGRDVALDTRLVDAFRRLLTEDPVDRAMSALMLSLPSEAYVAEQLEIIQVREIHQVRCDIRSRLASALRDELLACVDANRVAEPYRPDGDQAARRSLANTAWSYLALLDDGDIAARIHNQAVTADNMTDVHAALVCLVNAPAGSYGELARHALEHFYRRWHHEPLAVNLWLQVQATATPDGGLERVEALLAHEAFDIRNPNRVRALIGAFCNGNPVNFHRVDGAGYRFLADRVIELNALNPQIAARQLTPLTRWRRYPPALASLMKTQLQRILAVAALSPDVYEVASKSLAEQGGSP